MGKKRLNSLNLFVAREDIHFPDQQLCTTKNTDSINILTLHGPVRLDLSFHVSFRAVSESCAGFSKQGKNFPAQRLMAPRQQLFSNKRHLFFLSKLIEVWIAYNELLISQIRPGDIFLIFNRVYEIVIPSKITIELWFTTVSNLLLFSVVFDPLFYVLQISGLSRPCLSTAFYAMFVTLLSYPCQIVSFICTNLLNR